MSLWDKPSAESVLPTLRFSPYAWSKLLYLRDVGDTEVGGFGISSPDELFLIEDFVLVGQTCTWASVSFEDEAVADFFDEQVDMGRQPEQFSRCWIHTHPGYSAEPSGTDEKTFARVFGQSTWSVMFILARGGETYARLKFGCGPGAEILVPVGIAWDVPYLGTDHETWNQEYVRCVHPVRHRRKKQPESNCEELEEIETIFEEALDWDIFPAEQFDNFERNFHDAYENP